MTTSRILSAVFVLAALCSCQKDSFKQTDSASTTQKGGKILSITATLGSSSKASITDNGTALKYTWDANETISVFALDASNNILSIDTFTSTNDAGASSVTFSGAVSAAEYTRLVCYYPAFALSGSTYKVPSGKYHINEGSNYINTSVNDIQQAANASTSAIDDYTLLVGEVAPSGSTMTTSLKHLLTSVKCTIDLSGLDIAAVSNLKIEILRDGFRIRKFPR